MNAHAARWRLDGQTALVTGASAGIGFACARELAALGADVLIVARDEVHLDQARAELAEEFPRRELLAFAADVSVQEQRLDVFDWIADLRMPLSLLVNNAGANVTRSALDYGEDEYRSLIETNLICGVRAVPARAPALARTCERRDRQRRLGVRHDPRAFRSRLRLDEGRAAPADAQSCL